jgi:hypothetical protein
MNLSGGGMDPVILVALTAHHTPTKYHVITLHGLTQETVILIAHIFTKMKPSIATKQTECGVYFSSMFPMKAPIHKIQSCFMIGVVEFVIHGCLI